MNKDNNLLRQNEKRKADLLQYVYFQVIKQQISLLNDIFSYSRSIRTN